MAAAMSIDDDVAESKWGRVPADQGVRFFVRDGLDHHPDHVGKLSPVADLTATWGDVVRGRLANHPADRDAVWYISVVDTLSPEFVAATKKENAGFFERIGPQKDETNKPEMAIVGIHLPLGQRLRQSVPPGRVVEIWIPRPPHPYVHPFEHEKIKYAMAAVHCGRTWPPWANGDTDVINMQVLGGWDEKKEGAGSSVADRDQDNSIRNLVGLRQANGVVIYANLHGLRTSLRSFVNNQLERDNPTLNVKIFNPITSEFMGYGSYKFRHLCPAWFMFRVLGIIWDGFAGASTDDRLVHSITYTLPVINVALLVQIAQRETGPVEKFELDDETRYGTPEPATTPSNIEDCVNCSFGRALAAVEIQYDLVAEQPRNKRARDSEEYNAAVVVGEASLEDFLDEEENEDPRTYNADDAWEFFLQGVVEDSALSADDGARLAAHLTDVKNGRKKTRAATGGRARLSTSHRLPPWRRHRK